MLRFLDPTINYIIMLYFVKQTLTRQSFMVIFKPDVARARCQRKLLCISGTIIYYMLIPKGILNASYLFLRLSVFYKSQMSYF